MGKEAMHLAKENLCMERDFQAEDITVLRVQITLPQCEGNDRRARRFNRYYRRCAAAYLRYCETELLPRAAEQMREAMERSAPWSMVQANLSYTLTLQRDDVVSLYTDAEEKGLFPSLTLRRADTWNMYDGLPLRLVDFFPTGSHPKKQLLRHGRETILLQIEQGRELFYPQWRFALRRFYSSRNYYLTPEKLVWFYPMYSLAGAAGGIVSFSLPYEEMRPFLPPLP